MSLSKSIDLKNSSEFDRVNKSCEIATSPHPASLKINLNNENNSSLSQKESLDDQSDNKRSSQRSINSNNNVMSNNPTLTINRKNESGESKKNSEDLRGHVLVTTSVSNLDMKDSKLMNELKMRSGEEERARPSILSNKKNTPVKPNAESANSEWPTSKKKKYSIKNGKSEIGKDLYLSSSKNFNEVLMDRESSCKKNVHADLLSCKNLLFNNTNDNECLNAKTLHAKELDINSYKFSKTSRLTDIGTLNSKDFEAPKADPLNSSPTKFRSDFCQKQKSSSSLSNDRFVVSNRFLADKSTNVPVNQKDILDRIITSSLDIDNGLCSIDHEQCNKILQRYNQLVEKEEKEKILLKENINDGISPQCDSTNKINRMMKAKTCI